MSADACLQPAGRVRVGERFITGNVPAENFAQSLASHQNREYWEKVKADIERQNRQYPFRANANNLAVALIHLGEIKPAIALLEDAERKSPGQYETAANLGTAYELDGENQKALSWIKEGVNRKNESHYGTEWLHVKILEAKLALEKDQNWLKHNSILAMNLQNGDAAQLSAKPVTDFRGAQKPLVEIEDALVYQLHERLEFVPAPDLVVADLLLDLSRVFSITRTTEHRNQIRNLALKYGAEPPETTKNTTPVENAVPPGKSKNSFVYIILCAILATLAALFAIVVGKRRLR